jgi:tRNA (guanine-N7-)-methyltransferase
MSRGRRINRIKLKPWDEAKLHRYRLDWDAKDLLRDPDDFPRISSPALFGNQRPLEVEIGAGSGEMLVSLAKQSPGTNFLGIEVSHRAAIYAASLAADAQLGNLRILRANFKMLIPLLEPNSWERAYLHFPDPVHKRRDIKRSIFTAGFLDAMASTLLPGGELSVASDKPEFFFAMLELAEDDGRFERACAARYQEGLQTLVKSRFQLFWERKGIRTLSFLLRKKPVGQPSAAA